MSTLLPPFEYAPAVDAPAAPVLRAQYGLFVAGQWVAASGDAAFDALDPATEAELTKLALADAADVDRAVRAARRGYEKYWRKVAPRDRGKYLFRIASALRDRAREFAHLAALEGGMPLRTALESELPHAIASLFYHAGWADKLHDAAPGVERIRPLGVVGAVLSADAPLSGALAKLGPALACGNTLVLEPDEHTSLYALLFAQLCADADLPAGVVNVVTGDARTGAALVEHPDLDKLAFDGTPEEGRQIARTFAASNKRLALRLSGTPPCLVYDDAPLDQVVDAILSAVFAGGTKCLARGAHLLVQENVRREFLERMRDALNGLRQGNPLDANTDAGPLPSRARRDASMSFVREALEAGASLVQSPWQPPEAGFWFSAAMLVEPPGATAREALPGPLLTLRTFRTVEESLALAATLAPAPGAYVWTSSGQLALFAAERLRHGVVWCNTNERSDPSAPSGGYGRAGLGREGGPAGLREYLAL
jgi:aldehyde dehydrogenase (NAD+)